MIRSRPERRTPSATARTPPTRRKLSTRRVLRKPFARQLVRRSEERERDRKVEAGAFLLQLRRRQVDGDPASGPLQLGGDDAASDPLLRFLTGTVRQPDDGQRRRLAALNVRFHLDATRLEADEGKGDRAREHGLDATRDRVTRLCRFSARSTRLRRTLRNAGPCGG